MFIPEPNFSIPDLWSRVKKIPDPQQRIYVFLAQKSVSKLSEIWSGILTFYPSRVPDPGVKKAPDLESGSATLAERLLKMLSGQIKSYIIG